MRRLPRASLHPVGRGLIALLALTVGPAGCEAGDAGEDVIDRETFVAAWVDLRAAAMGRPDQELPAEERARILAGHGVDEDDLIAFAEEHGADIAFMKSVWDEVEVRLQERGLGEGTPVPDPGAESTG